MTTFLLYDLKVALLIVVFYMFYRLLVAYDTFHRLNRIVLLASLALSLVLPLCVVTVHKVVEVSASPNVEVGGVALAQAEPAGIGWSTVLAVVFFLGVVLTLARTLYNIYSVRRLMKSCREVAMPGYVPGCPPHTRLLVSDDENVSPFSWMKTVVLSRKDYEQDLVDGSEGHSIVLAHECGHVACRHSADMLFVDVIAALQWFNPVVWLLREDLRIVHEYEADARVLSQGFNSYQYLNFLILKAAGNAGYSIANGISTSSVLSKRVKMMVKDKSSRYSWVKVLYVVPIVAISLVATAKTVVEYKVKEAPKAETPAVIQSAEGEEKALAELANVVVAEEKNEVLTPETEANANENNVKLALLGDDNALYVINGNVASKDEMMKLNPEDIESVTVLKEKSATEMWGSRGANGVVMIKTKIPTDVAATKAVGDTIVDGGSAGALTVVEHLPEFPGGGKALLEFMMNNVKYPEEAAKKGLQGRVVVNFIVEKDGSLTNVNVMRSVDPLLDAEAIRVVKAMPKWTPGKQKGKPVRVKFNIPVTFKLQ